MVPTFGCSRMTLLVLFCTTPPSGFLLLTGHQQSSVEVTMRSNVAIVLDWTEKQIHTASSCRSFLNFSSLSFAIFSRSSCAPRSALQKKLHNNTLRWCRHQQRCRLHGYVLMLTLRIYCSKTFKHRVRKTETTMSKRFGDQRRTMIQVPSWQRELGSELVYSEFGFQTISWYDCGSDRPAVNTLKTLLRVRDRQSQVYTLIVHPKQSNVIVIGTKHCKPITTNGNCSCTVNTVQVSLRAWPSAQLLVSSSRSSIYTLVQRIGGESLISRHAEYSRFLWTWTRPSSS